ncbi:uncharacterized protein LOC136029020 isoform X2 [Artemia franciscana]|nr:hypothetical protein QYM36_015084 [Artemia franciscana]
MLPLQLEEFATEKEVSAVISSNKRLHLPPVEIVLRNRYEKPVFNPKAVLSNDQRVSIDSGAPASVDSLKTEEIRQTEGKASIVNETSKHVKSSSSVHNQSQMEPETSMSTTKPEQSNATISTLEVKQLPSIFASRNKKSTGEGGTDIVSISYLIESVTTLTPHIEVVGNVQYPSKQNTEAQSHKEISLSNLKSDLITSNSPAEHNAISRLNIKSELMHQDSMLIASYIHNEKLLEQKIKNFTVHFYSNRKQRSFIPLAALQKPTVSDVWPLKRRGKKDENSSRDDAVVNASVVEDKITSSLNQDNSFEISPTESEAEYHKYKPPLILPENKTILSQDTGIFQAPKTEKQLPSANEKELELISFDLRQGDGVGWLPYLF